MNCFNACSMPSPLGHALAGVSAAWLAGGRLPSGLHGTLFLPIPGRVSPPSVEVRGRMIEVALFASAGIAPDLDLLFGSHSTYTHSVGAILLVSLLTLALGGARHWRVALAIAAAWGSHVLLDWLGNDTSPPIGIMALWPFDGGYYQSSLYLFDAISRRYWLPEQFIIGNLRAAAKELLILGPAVCVAYLVRSRSR
jgi:membrane-bound metal-dependent hydrolase YbcI (DUF457 family)